MISNTLIVIVGATGIGKTAVSIQVAKHFKTDIISADSRQIFKEMKIGTASPTAKELSLAKHFNIATKSIHDYYSAWEFEQDALPLITDVITKKNTVILTGGSMMYIDAVCRGIDDIPTIPDYIRKELLDEYNSSGFETIKRKLKLLDPDYYNQVDLKNHKRVIHAVEVCIVAGKPYSKLRTGNVRKRPFNIVKIGIEASREVMFERINRRVDLMMETGLLKEAKELYKFKYLNSLNTVGYKELFGYFDGEYSLERAIELIKRNTRRYAKKQVLWFKKDENTKWFDIDNTNEIIPFLEEIK